MRRMLLLGCVLALACGDSPAGLEPEPEPTEAAPTAAEMLDGRWVAVGGDYTLPHCSRDCDHMNYGVLAAATLDFRALFGIALDSTFYGVASQAKPDSITQPHAMEVVVRWGYNSIEKVDGRWRMEMHFFQGESAPEAALWPLIECGFTSPCGLVARDTLTLNLGTRHTKLGLPGGNLAGRWIYVRQ